MIGVISVRMHTVITFGLIGLCGSTAAHVKFLFCQLLLQPTTRKIVTFKLVLARNLETEATTSVNSFPLIMTFPQFAGLLRNLLNYVAISFGT